MIEQTQTHPLVINIYIPFCVSRCPHCNRDIQVADETTRHCYVEALQREIQAAAPDFSDAMVESVCFSGGSPTCLAKEDFIALAQCLRQNFSLVDDAEITVETMPNRVDASWMVAFQQAKVTRLSIGLVTGHARDAARIGLPASIGSMETTLILPQMFGLKSYETELLYGLPGQTPQSFSLSLRFAVRYHAPEITLSRWQPVGTLPAPLPKEEEIQQMLEYAAQHLTEKGYCKETAGRWILPGHSSHMRQAIKSGMDLLSFGVGTESFTEGIRYTTTSRLGTYLYHSDEPDQIYTVLSRNK